MLIVILLNFFFAFNAQAEPVTQNTESLSINNIGVIDNTYELKWENSDLDQITYILSHIKNKKYKSDILHKLRLQLFAADNLYSDKIYNSKKLINLRLDKLLLLTQYELLEQLFEAVSSKYDGFLANMIYIASKKTKDNLDELCAIVQNKNFPEDNWLQYKLLCTIKNDDYKNMELYLSLLYEAENIVSLTELVAKKYKDGTISEKELITAWNKVKYENSNTNKYEEIDYDKYRYRQLYNKLAGNPENSNPLQLSSMFFNSNTINTDLAIGYINKLSGNKNNTTEILAIMLALLEQNLKYSHVESVINTLLSINQQDIALAVIKEFGNYE